MRPKSTRVKGADGRWYRGDDEKSLRRAYASK